VKLIGKFLSLFSELFFFPFFAHRISLEAEIYAHLGIVVTWNDDDDDDGGCEVG
jgi:hypothetical protein